MNGLRLCCLVACALSASGCVASSAMQFTAVSISELPPDFQILEKDVVGEDCPNGIGGYGSYAEATRRAIESVPEANALINAAFSSAEHPIARICVKVVGDAVRL